MSFADVCLTHTPSEPLESNSVNKLLESMPTEEGDDRTGRYIYF